MTGATTLSYKGERVGTGYGKPWSSADVAAVKALLEQGWSATRIGRRLGFDFQRVRGLVRRLEGRASVRGGGGKSANSRIKTTERIQRNCLRCRRPFIADAKVLFMCVPCREFAREAA